MLSENPNDGVPEQKKTRQPEFVGAPTEYADAQEVPEAISFLAKLVAGGVLTWSLLAGLAILLMVGCMICGLLAFGAGGLF